MNKKPIIIVGSGKAALLHLNGYMRLWDIGDMPQIYIIKGQVIEPDIDILQKKFSAKIHFRTYEQVTAIKCAGQLDDEKNNTIIDICTPTETHRNVIEKMLNAGFNRFLVEKPMITTSEDLEWIKSRQIHIEVMQNYLFSKATQKVAGLIRSREIIPKSMTSFFCKDRIKDSVNKRGFSGNKPPHVFTVEFPHQLYLASEFLGAAKINMSNAQNMRIKDRVFLNHGTGVISLEHADSTSLHFTCLSSDKPIKCVIINCVDGQTLTINYPLSKNRLTSTVEFKDGFGNIHLEIFEDDDMIKRALEHYYANLTLNKPNKCYSMEGTELVINALLKTC